MKIVGIPAIALCLLAPIARGQSADEVRKELNLEAATLQAWASDKAIVDAVKQQNAKAVPLARIKQLDEEWVAGHADALVRQSTTGACADRLRALVSHDARYGETFVMDNQGALVCATQQTSDYWQGDEAKWTRSFNGGHGETFIDRPKLDHSAKAHLAQISLPILDAGRTIGAITVGIEMDHLVKKK